MSVKADINIAELKNLKKCKHCKKKVVDSYECENCNASFHPSCANQAKVTNKSGKVFCCVVHDHSEVIPNKSVDSGLKKSDNLIMDERKLKSIIRETIQQSMNAFELKINTKMDDLEKSVQHMSNIFDEQITKFESVLNELKTLKKENEDLKSRLQIVENKLDNFELKEKENNMVIIGVPKQENLSTYETISKICASLQTPLSNEDINETYRVSKKEDAPILVKFKSRIKKNEIMTMIKSVKGTTVEKCQLQGTNRKIYLNDDLPVKKRELLKLARDFKNEKGYKAAFCRNGIIYLRKTDQDAPIKIRSNLDLQT